jgi:membrane protease YdiL (CAAX protease family)
MKYRIRNQQDFAAGVIYIVGGAGFALGALNYKIGEAARMGPGWFPFAVGVLLAIVGVFTTINAIRPQAAEEKVKRPELGSLAWVLGGVVLFGLLLPHLGLVISMFVLVMVSSKASHEFKWLSAFINSIFLVAFCIGVFIYGIHLQMPLWPDFIG